jgi:GTP cyclohydrolase I
VSAKIRTVDKEKIKVATRMLLEAIGEDPEDKRFRRTPERVAKFWEEFLNRGGVNIRVFEEKHNGLVVVKDIPFSSVCEHHLLPFFGLASVGYLPRNKVIGLSKIVRIVNTFACRPQLQERLTDQIADYLWDILKPLGVIVVTKATHFCMVMRQLGDQTTQTIASALRGKFYDDATLRAEVYSLLKME